LKPLAVIFCIFTVLMSAEQSGSRMPPVKFTDTTLDNGLRVIISEDHFAPVYAIAISYKVGSRDERPGHTGFAQVLEHMMFKGSENVGPGEHVYDISTKGGGMSGNANTDRTLFQEILPKNQIDLGLYLEADRMRSLAITKENLDSQRKVVKEERRQGLDSQPYGQTPERVDDLVYDNFPYKHSVIGSMADLDAATVEDVQQFFKTYYAPNNAVLALAGDLDTKEALGKVKKYFGGIPRQPAPKPADLNEPEKTGERRARMEDRLATATRIEIAWRIPEITSADTRALVVAASVLGGGDSSRLQQRLVKENQLAALVGCVVDGRAGPSTLRVVVFLKPGKTVPEVEGAISEEIANLSSEPVSQQELEHARRAIKRTIAPSRESVLSVAISLADDAALFNDPNRINTESEKRLAVTAADIQKAARAWLRNANRVIVVTEPAAAPPARGQ
jgi:zinc protease